MDTKLRNDEITFRHNRESSKFLRCYHCIRALRNFWQGFVITLQNQYTLHNIYTTESYLLDLFQNPHQEFYDTRKPLYQGGGTKGSITKLSKRIVSVSPAVHKKLITKSVCHLVAVKLPLAKYHPGSLAGTGYEETAVPSARSDITYIPSTKMLIYVFGRWLCSGSVWKNNKVDIKTNQEFEIHGNGIGDSRTSIDFSSQCCTRVRASRLRTDIVCCECVLA